jgi:hypothetical protein
VEKPVDKLEKVETKTEEPDFLEGLVCSILNPDSCEACQ